MNVIVTNLFNTQTNKKLFFVKLYNVIVMHVPIVPIITTYNCFYNLPHIIY